MSSLRLRIWQVDAFTGQLFRGNPAAVVPLHQWLEDDVLQSIAAENNLSETAFCLSTGEGRWHLRWFTPTVEVDLCGHATLAAAWVILHEQPGPSDVVTFDTRSGPLTVRAGGDDLLSMDFPAVPAGQPIEDPAVVEALRVEPLALYPVKEVHVGRYLLAELPDRAAVAALDPDIVALGALGVNLIATAPGDDEDFVSRFFAPASGVAEDPVTGSAHCTLGPFWAERMGKTDLFARQISARGGEVHVSVQGARVQLSGQVVPYLRGTFWL